MKLLVVSDIHYSLKQYDWLVRNVGAFDLIVIAGDLLELASPVDLETQASVVTQYFRRIAARTPLVVCSGNHDLLADYEGHRSAEWLQEVAIPDVTVDHNSFANESLRILSLPWWETEKERARASEWLASRHEVEDPRPVFWVHHAPPKGAQVSWNGRRDHGDRTLREWIDRYQPAAVLCGHVHDAPYYSEGSWIDRIGQTVVLNAGKQTGEKPATIEIELCERRLTWCGMEGCEEHLLRDAPLPSAAE